MHIQYNYFFFDMCRNVQFGTNAANFVHNCTHISENLQKFAKTFFVQKQNFCISKKKFLQFANVQMCKSANVRKTVVHKMRKSAAQIFFQMQKSQICTVHKNTNANFCKNVKFCLCKFCKFFVVVCKYFFLCNVKIFKLIKIIYLKNLKINLKKYIIKKYYYFKKLLYLKKNLFSL